MHRNKHTDTLTNIYVTEYGQKNLFICDNEKKNDDKVIHKN